MKQNKQNYWKKFFGITNQKNDFISIGKSQYNFEDLNSYFLLQ